MPPVAGDPAELREALTNLVVNALDAMPGGGTLTLRTEADGRFVSCVVGDTGVGMPEDVMRQIFQPFFTTKGEQGSGLGLSIVRGIVARHGGVIHVQSQAGHGTTFTLRLPVAASPPDPGARVEVPPSSRSATTLAGEPEETRGEGGFD